MSVWCDSKTYNYLIIIDNISTIESLSMKIYHLSFHQVQNWLLSLILIKQINPNMDDNLAGEGLFSFHRTLVPIFVMDDNIMHCLRMIFFPRNSLRKTLRSLADR